MKFSVLALSTLLAFAAAEVTTTAETVTATLTPEQSCANNCMTCFPAIFVVWTNNILVIRQLH